MIAEYNAHLKAFFIGNCIGISLLLICLCTLFFLIINTLIKGYKRKKVNTIRKVYSFKKKKWIKKKREILTKKVFRDRIISFSILIVLFSVILTIFTFSSVIPTKLDLDEEAYATYEGEFWVDNTNYGRGCPTAKIKLINDQKTVNYKFSIHLEPDFEEKTNYTGYIVYSRRSKIIVDWNGKKTH